MARGITFLFEGMGEDLVLALVNSSFSVDAQN